MLDFNFNYLKQNAKRVSIQANHHYVLAPVAPEVADSAGWQVDEVAGAAPPTSSGATLLLELYVQAWADEERPKGFS